MILHSCKTYHVLCGHKWIASAFMDTQSDFPDITITNFKSDEVKGSGILTFFKIYFFDKKSDLVIADGLRMAFLFTLLNTIFFWKKIRILVYNTYFYYPSRKPLIKIYQIMKATILKHSVRHFILFSTSEQRDCQKIFKISANKLSYIPFHILHENELSKFEPHEEDFIFSGGNSCRDYETLFEAVSSLEIKTRVFSTINFDMKRLPKNVEIILNDHSVRAFYGPMSNAILVVILLESDILRSAGQGTYLSAMYLGKCCIVSDTPGVRDLIEDGETGIIVPPRDPEKLRNTIIELLSNRNRRNIIGTSAKKYVSQHRRYKQHMINTFTVVQNALRIRDI